MAVLTVYATRDGGVQGVDAVYATARSTATTAYDDSLWVGQAFAGADYDVREGFIYFPLSVPANCVIVSSTLSLCVAAIAGENFTLEARYKDWGATLTTADWVAGSDIAALDYTQVRATAQSGDATVYQYLDFDTLVDFASGYVFLSSDGQRSADAPDGNAAIQFFSAVDAGKEPKLTVEYLSHDATGGYLAGALGRATAWSRELTAAEMQAAFANGMVIFDRPLDSGTVVLQGDVKNRQGAVIPAHHVRAGQWIQHLEVGDGKPRMISGHSVDLAAGKNALTIGRDWMVDEIGVRMADLLAMPATVVADVAAAASTEPGVLTDQKAGAFGAAADAGLAAEPEAYAEPAPDAGPDPYIDAPQDDPSSDSIRTEGEDTNTMTIRPGTAPSPFGSTVIVPFKK